MNLNIVAQVLLGAGMGCYRTYKYMTEISLSQRISTARAESMKEGGGERECLGLGFESYSEKVC